MSEHNNTQKWLTQEGDNSWPNLALNITSAFTNLKPAGVFWPKITVVTPASNNNQDLEETILSVINQEYPNLEYIVGSNAENQELLLKYQDFIDKGLQPLAHANLNLNLNLNLNQAFNQATGTLITWVKSGEMLAPGALFMAALTYLKEKCDVIGGIAIGHQYQNITWVKKSAFSEEYLNLESGEHLKQLWERNSKYRQEKLIFTRTAWEKITTNIPPLNKGGLGGVNTTYNLDYELIVKFALQGVSFAVMSWPLICFQEQVQEDIDRKYIEEIVRIREKYCDLKPSQEREQEITRKIRDFLKYSGRKILVISKAVKRYFCEKTEQEIQEYFQSRNYHFSFCDLKELETIDLINFDCIIRLYHLDNELNLVEKIRGDCFSGLVIIWSWDNHTHYNMNAITAKTADIFIPAHKFTEKLYKNSDSILTEFMPLCTSQWTTEEAQEFFAAYGHKKRSNKLFGGFTKYPHGQKRNVLLDQIIEQMPESKVFVFPHGNGVYFDLNPAQRFEQWATYKVSICLPLKNDLSQRFFDALLCGQIPIVPEDIFDLDAVIPPYLQAMLPVIKFRNYDVESVQTAYQEAITRFDAEGIEGVNRRHKFALENHLFVHRLDAILGMINNLANKQRNYPTDISTLQNNIYLDRVDEKEIEIAPDEILCFVVERNESLRMPYFLEYYRSQGVDKFLIVDNDSTDNTRTYLAQQPDVYLWKSDRSYAAADVGIDWVQLLLQNYGVDHWCLTVDADEFLYYPDCETKDIRTLCEELELENKQAMRAVLLDMYSEKPIKNAEYIAGQNPLEVCPYFDKKFYSTKQEKPGQGRHLTSYSGGVRWRVFGLPEYGSFNLNKIPLLKYDVRVKLNRGYHSIDNVNLAYQTGCLLHFKFFSTFPKYVKQEVEREEHANGAKKYQQYAKKFEENPNLTLFSSEHSVKFKDSQQLLELGVIINEKDWNSLGNIYLNEGNYEDALKCYEKLYKINGEKGFPYNKLGLALELTGKIDEAIAVGKKHIENILKRLATIQEREITKTGYQIAINQWCGRLGNNLIQLAHALYIAEKTKSEVIIPSHKLIKLDKIDYKFDLTDNREICEEKLKSIFFYKSDNFNYQISYQDYRRIFTQYLLKLIPFTIDKNVKDETLVIHIRSGDIFRKQSQVHERYIQPSLSYYQKIIQDNDYQDIVIVTEQDRHNPCINALKEWRPSIKIQTGTLEEDISTILSAKNLVIGKGSFALTLAMMSQNINKLYLPLFEVSNWNKFIDEETSDDLGVIEELKNISLDFENIIYEFTEYIKTGEWRNTPEQRELMISYPEEKIQVVESARIQELRNQIETNPQQDIKVYIELGDALRQRGLWKEAIKYYSQVINIQNHPAAYLGLGYAHKMQGNLDTAINYYQEGIKLTPNDHNLYIKLADVFLEKGEVEKGLVNYEKAVALNYQAFWLYLKIGDIYKKLGDLEKATANYEKAIENSPNEIWLYLKLARIYQQQGLIGKEEAFTKYQQAIELSNGNSDTYLSIAHFYFLQGELDEVVNSYYQILKKNKAAWIYQRLERALKLQGEDDDAKILMESAPVIQKQKQKLAWLDVIICSSGGVGTSFFMDFVQKYKYINSPSDIDGLKHLDQPPTGKTKQNFKALYIFGDPLNAVVSLFRRNYQQPHSCKLLANYLDIEPIARYCSLEEYVNEGIDRLKLEQHFDNWSNAQVNYPIMLVKYETMWEHLPEIFDFLEIPTSEIEELEKERKERESDWIKLPEETKDKLSAMYGKFSEKVANFEEIKIIEPQEIEPQEKENNQPQNFLQRIDKIFCLTLKESESRRSHAKKELDSLGISDFEFFFGTNKSDPIVQEFYDKDLVLQYPPCFRCGQLTCGKENCNNILIEPQVATFISHLNIWKTIILKNYSSALIVEDDIKFNDYALEVIEKIVKFSEIKTLLNNEIPFLLRLGWALNQEHNYVYKTKMIPNFLKMSNPCYAINQKMAQVLIEKFEKIYTTVDIYLHQDIGLKYSNYTLLPPLAHELSWSIGSVDSLIHPKSIRVNYLNQENNFNQEMVAKAKKRVEEHFNHVLYRNILVVGHPKSGSGYMTQLLQSFGLDIGHELMKQDGISSWMFAVIDENNPFALNKYAKTRKYSFFKYIIHHVRNPQETIPSIIRDNQFSDLSYQFRKKHIQKQLGINLDEYSTELEKAVISFLCWNAIIEQQNPHLIIKVEQDQLKMLKFLQEQKLTNIKDLDDVNLPSQDVNKDKPCQGVVREKPIITEAEWKQLPQDLKNKLNDFCQKYGYSLMFTI